MSCQRTRQKTDNTLPAVVTDPLVNAQRAPDKMEPRQAMTCHVAKNSCAGKKGLFPAHKSFRQSRLELLAQAKRDRVGAEIRLGFGAINRREVEAVSSSVTIANIQNRAFKH